MREVSSMWTLIFLQTTPSSHQSSSSSLKSTTPTLTRTVRSVSIFWRSNTHLHCTSEIFSSASKACLRILNLMVILSVENLTCSTSLTSARTTSQSMRQLPVNGPASTLCEFHAQRENSQSLTVEVKVSKYLMSNIEALAYSLTSVP